MAVNSNQSVTEGMSDISLLQDYDEVPNCDEVTNGDELGRDSIGFLLQMKGGNEATLWCVPVELLSCQPINNK